MRRWGTALLLAALGAGHAVADPTPATPSAWTVGLFADEDWDSNVLFRPDGDDDTATRVGLRLRRDVTTPRTTASVEGNGSFVRYGTLSDLNRGAYGGNLSATYLLTRRTSVTVRDDAQSTYSHEVTALTSTGLLLPYVRTRSNAAELDTRYELDRRWTLAVGARHDLVDFDSSTLVDGSGLTGRAVLEHALSHTDTGLLSGEWQHGTARGQGADIATSRLGWRTDRHLWKLELAAGVMRVESFGSTDASVTAAFDATLTHALGAGSVFLRASRAADPGYGIGRTRTYDTVAFGATTAPGRRVAATLGGSWTRSHDPIDTTLLFDAYGADAALRCVSRAGNDVHATYAFRRRTDGTVPGAVSEHTVSFGVTYAHRWR
jgi:hypothetical protein